MRWMCAAMRQKCHKNYLALENFQDAVPACHPEHSSASGLVKPSAARALNIAEGKYFSDLTKLGIA